MKVILIQRIETPESQAKWAQALQRVQVEYERIQNYVRMHNSGMSLGNTPIPSGPPEFTQEEVAARDFSQGYHIATFNATGEDLPNLREMITIGQITYVVFNREFVYRYEPFIQGQCLDTVYLEVIPFDAPPITDSELRMYGNTPPISKIQIVEKPQEAN